MGPRASSRPFTNERWPGGHANTTIVGRGGRKPRINVRMGVSLLAPPAIPRSSHGPKEVGLLLSPGRFKHGASSWFEPGLGGSLHNEPHINHAMGSDELAPLAIWRLWPGQAPSKSIRSQYQADGQCQSRASKDGRLSSPDFFIAKYFAPFETPISSLENRSGRLTSTFAWPRFLKTDVSSTSVDGVSTQVHLSRRPSPMWRLESDRPWIKSIAV